MNGILRRESKSKFFKNRLDELVYKVACCYYETLSQAQDPWFLGTAIKLGELDNPFSCTFEGGFVIMVKHEDVLGKKWRKKGDRDEFFQNLRGLFDPLHGSRYAGIEEDQKKTLETGEPYDGWLPKEIDREAFQLLPLRAQSTVLHSYLPKLTLKWNEFNQEMYKYLVTQPTWIGYWIRNPTDLLLLPEHYKYLIKALQDLSELQHWHAEEIGQEELLGYEYCLDELFEVLLKGLEHDVSRSVLLRVLVELVQSPAMDSVLEMISQVLSGDLNSAKLMCLMEMITHIMKNTEAKQALMEKLLPQILRIVCEEQHRTQVGVMLALRDMVKCIDFMPPNTKVVQAVLFMLVSQDEKLIGPALEIYDNLGDNAKGDVDLTPYVRKVFGAALAANEYKSITAIASRFQGLVAEKRNELLLVLERLLAEKGNPEEIGHLMSSLVPLRGDLLPAAASDDSLSYDSLSLSRNGSISGGLHGSDQFWEVYMRHKRDINGLLLENPDLLSSRSAFSFLNDYPEALDFQVKVKKFHQDVENDERHNGDMKHIRVKRETVLEDSLNALNYGKPSVFWGEFRVQFEGEEGFDAGGLTRDWFSHLTKAMLNPMYALFMPTDSGSYQPNPSSHVNSSHIPYFKFTGKIIACALVHQINVDAHFSTAFIKLLLRRGVSLRDLEAVDEQMAESLKWILENSIDKLEMGLTFSREYEYLGARRVVDLVPEGSSKIVTDENKAEYVKLIVEHRLYKQIEEQINAFCDGFWSVLELQTIRMFTPDELDLLICGIPEINVDDWREHCHYEYPFDRNHRVVRMFFEVISRWSTDDLAKLLLFITGSSQLPVQGFSSFSDSGHPITISPGGEKNRLPVAHTCMNVLNLPEYDNETDMDEKLRYAITECNGFGFI